MGARLGVGVVGMSMTGGPGSFGANEHCAMDSMMGTNCRKMVVAFSKAMSRVLDPVSWSVWVMFASSVSAMASF